ncbi:MAG: hypothetical protein OK455_10825, partial [Thaumarchaeota archaeon]|nr:hypothetical protein [Nitrososphaerota archaeon]
MKRGRAISKIAGLAVVLVLVAALGIAALFAAQPTKNSSTSVFSSSTTPISAQLSTTLAVTSSSSTESSPASSTSATTTTSSTSFSSTTSSTSSTSAPAFDAGVALDAHLANVSSRNIQAIMAAYSSDASVQWEGQTLQPYGLAGTYSGASNIRSLYSATIVPVQKITLSASGLNASSPASGSSSKVTANAKIVGTGTSSMLGQFNITVNAQITYQLVGSSWLISQEVWNFVMFHSQNTGGATTFPQWQITGPPLPQRYS